MVVEGSPCSRLRLGGRELGDGLGALRDGVLGELAREGEAHGGLDLARREGALLVVAAQLARRDGDALYDQAIALVAREGKASTSFVQRHLQIGYNRAARLIERMESEGIISAPNHVGKRQVLARKVDQDVG